MTADKQPQGELQPLRRTNHSTSGILLDEEQLIQVKRRFSPGGILAITLGGIILGEVIAMIVVYNFRDWPYNLQVLLDAAVMTVIIFPARPSAPDLDHL